ncbi:Zinc finger, SWIM-type [Melia azedarach]|uniref:Zinc finger, SWIM-type n=1 Tax=Melia azedarach TaxID=155640 RepID=A0ACC1X8D7_MELAZ|nr:Zinc finger, SWIM-type [Melia azedarach]
MLKQGGAVLQVHLTSQSYWCSFGPDDHRKGGIVRPSRNTYVPKKKNAGRPNTKRGCTCHFIVKRLIAEPSVALIIYNDDKHVDKNGLPCHGPQDKKAAGTRAMFAPYISEDLRLRVLSLLYVGVSVETIMQRHNESVERQGGPCNRDDLLTHRYVRRQERSIRRSTYELDLDDAVSVKMWVESHQSHVFFYEDFSDYDPFTLGIQTEWQLQQMIRFGNGSLVASDSRFGTNKLKYPLHSLIVFNSDNKAIPVAWIIAPRFASADAHRWMRALYNRVRTKDPTWKLAGFIVDDPSADVLTIRDVFQCSVLISIWRVRHAWHKNLVKRCSEIEMRAEIFRRLGMVVDDICKGNGNVVLFEDCMQDFMDGSDFMDYFKAVWYPRIGSWITALKTLRLASKETSATMEFYHNQLKVRLLNEKDPVVYQRADWLVDKLGTKVHSYFWLDEYSGKDDFARYWKDEWASGLTSWRKAVKIPDSNVVIEGRCAKVIDQLDRDKAYVVWNPGSQFGFCNCSWAGMGYLCEHLLKVIKVCRKQGSIPPSVSLFQYNHTLIDMLHCSPHDCLFRDHAVSLAVFVQKQLNALMDFESGQTTVDPVEKQIVHTNEQQIVGTVSNEQDRELVNESHEKDCVGEEDALCGTANNLGGELINQSISGNGVCGVTTEEENSYTKMDVDQSPIYISTPGLVSIDDIVSRDGFSKNVEGVLISDAEISGNAHSTDAVFTDQNGAEVDISNKNSLQAFMDVEPLAINIPPSTTEFLEQCHVSPQHGVSGLDPDPLLLSNKLDANTISDKASLSMPVPVESKVASVTETSGVVNSNGNELEGANATAANGPCFTENAVALDTTNDSNNLPNDEAVHGITSLNSKSSRNHPSMPSDHDKQESVEAAALQTDSFKEPWIDKPSLTKCDLKRSAKDGDCDNELIITKKSKIDNELDNHLEVVSSCNSTANEGPASVCQITDADADADAPPPLASPSLEKHQTYDGIASKQ